MPGTFNLAAEAMGMTTQELIKLVETGKLMSVDFLPNFADKMREMVRETGQLSAALNTSRTAMGRFKTSFENNVLNAFEAGTEEGLSAFFNDLTVSMKKLEPLFTVVGKVAGAVFEIVGQLVRAIVQLVGPMKAFGKDGEDAVDGLNKGLTETLSLIDGIVAGFKFIASVFTIIPSMIERLESVMGPRETLDEMILSGKIKTIKSGVFARQQGTTSSSQSTTNYKTVHLSVTAGDVDHFAQIVRDTLQEDSTLNYGD